MKKRDKYRLRDRGRWRTKGGGRKTDTQTKRQTDRRTDDRQKERERETLK